MPELTLFRAPTIQQTADQLARECPEGRSFGNKFKRDSNTHRLIRCMGASLNLIQQQIDVLAKEFNINLSQDLLPEWEASVNLPDECQRNLTTLAQRRAAIITKLRKMPVVTKAEYDALGTELAGITVTVTDGVTFGLPDSVFDKYAKFRIYVQFINPTTGFPLVFPFAFGGVDTGLVECVFRKITPANVVIKIV